MKLVLASFFLRCASVFSLFIVLRIGVTYRLIALKQHHATTLIACRKVVARLIKFNGGNDVGCARCQQLHAGINKLYRGGMT